MNDAPPPKERKQTGTFTGRHMAIIMVCFFGIIIAVNFVMARLAVSTFGGTVVDNSYVASQKFNGWLADAEAQEQAGWQKHIVLDSKRHLIVRLTKSGGNLADVRLIAQASHPLGMTETNTLEMISLGSGRWQSVETIPTGRWLIHLTALEGADQAQFESEVR